jgi:hypothetical protein
MFFHHPYSRRILNVKEKKTSDGHEMLTKPIDKVEKIYIYIFNK